jgi:hypothetical protein
MAGLVPAIHDLLRQISEANTWMPATPAGMMELFEHPARWLTRRSRGQECWRFNQQHLFIPTGKLCRIASSIVTHPGGL